MISVDGLTVEFGGTTLFSDISFQINEKDRIALLKILAGVRQPTRGKVTAPKDCVVAYLPQHLMTEDGRTVFEEASMAFAHLREMEAEIERMNNELAVRTDYESDSYMELIEKVALMSEKFYAIDMTHFEEDVEKALLGLGFERSDFDRPTSDFSGGWRMRIELAKLLLQNPDVLLLDEPTNHLDIESIQWLEDFLINSAKAVVVISHDRKFVDNITTRTIEVTMGRIYDYKVNYSQYLVLRKERAEDDSGNQGLHRTLQGYVQQDAPGAEPCEDAGKAGTDRSGRGRHLGTAPEIPAFAPQRQLSGHHGRRRKDIRQPHRVPQCDPDHRTGRQGGLRR